MNAIVLNLLRRQKHTTCANESTVWYGLGMWMDGEKKKKADFGVRNYWNILNDCHAMLFQEHVIIHLMREKRTATNNE